MAAASGARWVRVIRRRVLVSGTVQGVFFRDSCRQAAQQADVVGWVRNLPDGRVEAVFEGDDGPVEQMVAWMRHGPPRAAVRHVEVIPEPLEGLLVFAVTD